MIVNWWQASIVANLAIAVVEYVNRVGGYTSFGRVLIVTWPLILAAQWGLFHSWRTAPSMLSAWAAFNLGNVILRIISVRFFVGEPISWVTLAGVALITAGGVVVRHGLK